MLSKQASIQQLEKKFEQLFKEKLDISNYDQWLADGNQYGARLQPLSRIHLHSNIKGEIESNGNYVYVTILPIIAFFVILIACINFTNLNIARSAARAKEIGVRKVVGSNRKEIAKQFLIESVMQSLIALTIAILIVELCLPAYCNLVQRKIEFGIIENPILLPMLIVFAMGIGVVAGSYPAFYLSSLNPIKSLGRKTSNLSLKSRLRSGLILFQFAVSIALILATMVVNKQLNFMRKENIGFTTEKMLVIHNTGFLKDGYPAFKNQLLSKTGIASVTGMTHLPAHGQSHVDFEAEGHVQKIGMNFYTCDFDFLETMQMKMQKGHFFRIEHKTDQRAVVMNQAAADMLKWKDPVGKAIRFVGGNQFHVIGVIENFHYESKRKKIEPLVIASLEGLGWNSRYIAVRIKSDDIKSMIDVIKQTWLTMLPDYPFQFSFMDEDYNLQYQNEANTQNIFSILSILAILTASLGLLALTVFMCEQRKKEVGLRKILGSSMTRIIGLLSKEFMFLIMTSNLIAWPIAWFAMNKWLENFAYRIHLTIGPFLLAGLTAQLVALLTVSWIAFRAATANPVESLRHE